MTKEVKIAVLKQVKQLLSTSIDQLEYDIYGVKDAELVGLLLTTLENQADVNIQLAISFLNKLGGSAS